MQVTVTKILLNNCLTLYFLGIAFMFLKIHQLKSLSKVVPDSLLCAQKYSNIAKGRKPAKNDCNFLCGQAGILAVSTVINYTLKDRQSFQEDFKNFEKGIQISRVLNFNKDGSDELLFGRAGYLSGMFWINSNLPVAERITRDKVAVICKVVVESGRQYAAQNNSTFPLLYHCWHEKYLGAAHGLSSILHMLLESEMYKDNIAVKTTIDKLLQLQTEEGNFPPALDDEANSSRLLHWCHGAPGVFYLFAKAYIVFQEEKYLNACLKCGDLIWHKGLLRKGPGICHGVAGNGYVFLILYRLTKDPKHLYRATKFMEFLTNEMFIKEARIPDRPFSLYEGLAGTVCFLVDLLDLEKAQFPFMDVFDVKI